MIQMLFQRENHVFLLAGLRFIVFLHGSFLQTLTFSALLSKHKYPLSEHLSILFSFITKNFSCTFQLMFSINLPWTRCFGTQVVRNSKRFYVFTWYLLSIFLLTCFQKSISFTQLSRCYLNHSYLNSLLKTAIILKPTRIVNSCWNGELSLRREFPGRFQGQFVQFSAVV